MVDKVTEIKETVYNLLSGEISEDNAREVYTALVSYLSGIDKFDDIIDLLKLYNVNSKLRDIDGEYDIQVEAVNHVIVAKKEGCSVISDLMMTVAKTIGCDGDTQPLIDEFTKAHKVEILSILAETEERYSYE